MTLDNDISHAGFGSLENGTRNWRKNHSLLSLHQGMSCVGHCCTDDLVSRFHYKTGVGGCCPPAAWQEVRDALWRMSLLLSSLILSWSRHQNPAEGQAPFLPPTSFWTCQPALPSPSMVPGAAGMQSRSPAN